MSLLAGVPVSTPDGEPRATWQEIVWAALAKPLRLPDVRRIALSNGGTEDAGTRYLKACLQGGTVVQAGGTLGNARYQRADQAKAGTTPTWVRRGEPAPQRERTREEEPEEVDDDAKDLEDRDEGGDELDAEEEDNDEAPPAPEESDVTNEIAKKPAPRGQTQDAVLAALGADEIDLASVAKRAGTSASVANATLTRLVNAGRVVRTGRGMYRRALAAPAKAVAAAPKPAAPAKTAKPAPKASVAKPPPVAAPAGGIVEAAERVARAQRELDEAKAALRALLG